MKTFLLFCLVWPASLFAQEDSGFAQLPFCGWKLANKKFIKAEFEEQFAFMAPQKGDTIVDIGAASGAYEGCLAAVFDLSELNFILVDIDDRCLNRTKVENMRRFYSSVKGDSIRNRFDIVVNTPDSLHLPLSSYRTAWLVNTLHELPSPEKMALDIAAILRKGGELLVLELLPHKEGQLHGGCKKPLYTTEKITSIFTSNGFRLIATKKLERKNIFTPALYRFRKE